MLNATKPPKATAYRNAICQVTRQLAAAISFGITGSVLGCQSGESFITTTPDGGGDRQRDGDDDVRRA